MKRLNRDFIGVAQGDIVLFSDCETDGRMWTGDGYRVSKTPVLFDEPFWGPPSVLVTLSMFDMANWANVRADIQALNVSSKGFDIIFRTWEDTKVARVRASWQAIGEVPYDYEHDELWDV